MSWSSPTAAQNSVEGGGRTSAEAKTTVLHNVEAVPCEKSPDVLGFLALSSEADTRSLTSTPTLNVAITNTSHTPLGSASGHEQFRTNTMAMALSPTAHPPLSLPDAISLPTHVGDQPRLPSGQFLGERFLSKCTSPTASAASVTPGCGRSLNSLKLQTDSYSTIAPGMPGATDGASVTSSLSAISTAPTSHVRPLNVALQHKSSNSSLKPESRPPSFKNAALHGFGTASTSSSTFPSPIISAMGDVSPLPSPLLSGDSPGPWKKLGRSPPRETPASATAKPSDSAFVTNNGESLASAFAYQARRKALVELLAESPDQLDNSDRQATLQLPRARNRTLSEYVPDHQHLPRRMVAVSATHTNPTIGTDHPDGSFETHIRREPHMSEARGLTRVEQPPIPPSSESSSLQDGVVPSVSKPLLSKKRYEFFEAYGRGNQKKRRWWAIKPLGQGTFSRVVLATSQMPTLSEANASCTPAGSFGPEIETEVLYDRRALVAIKICEHGPEGGASEDRVEMSLKRELEIMQCIHHPSLIHLKAWNIEPTRAILVLNYCPGGDLFDVASAHRNRLTPPLLARMFAELVGAVRYLHERHIVHRDIKLENVLVNVPPKELTDSSINWNTYPYSLTTLTDLGLSRHVSDDEKLETRCGSDDYAAPEVIMGQPYDGRATDAWSLGVLLYALLEGRLPFDPSPGMTDVHRMRSRTSHRIARVEWRWIEYEGEHGDHEGNTAKFQERGLFGAMQITEGLLRRARSRWSIDRVAQESWVRDAMAIEGGLQFREEEEAEEVL